MKNLYIESNKTIKDALKLMDKEAVKLLLVGKPEIFKGLLSIGDIQRAVLKDISLDTEIKEILRTDIVVASENESIEDIKKKMLQIRAEFMPVVKGSEVLRIIFWDDLFDSERPPVHKFTLPVVVMAGGLGTRLRPLTHVIPKPLIPIGDKTMLEEIFSRFNRYGCNEFHVSVNYKAELIEHYIENQKLPYEISYFKEKKPMGTGGSLSLLKSKVNKTFFVSNCDILIEQDYSEILDYHQKNNNEITIVAVMKQFPIAYGTIETTVDGLLTELKEKPDLNFKINSGMYILEPHLIDEVPDDNFFHITDLIEKLKNEKRRVGVFPIDENSWKDVGVWDSYLEQINIK